MWRLSPTEIFFKMLKFIKMKGDLEISSENSSDQKGHRDNIDKQGQAGTAIK